VVQECDRPWWVSVADSRGNVWNCRSCFSSRGPCVSIGVVAMLVELPSQFPLWHGVVLSSPRACVSSLCRSWSVSWSSPWQFVLHCCPSVVSGFTPTLLIFLIQNV
jgi:hypothetical protein